MFGRIGQWCKAQTLSLTHTHTQTQTDTHTQTHTHTHTHTNKDRERHTHAHVLDPDRDLRLENPFYMRGSTPFRSLALYHIHMYRRKCVT